MIYKNRTEIENYDKKQNKLRMAKMEGKILDIDDGKNLKLCAFCFLPTNNLQIFKDELGFSLCCNCYNNKRPITQQEKTIRV